MAGVLELERELQHPLTRANPERLRELLAPTFVEIGASGRRYDLAATLSVLSEEQARQHEFQPIEVHDLEGRRLQDGLIQVFWVSHRGSRRARRTSIWQHRAGRWQQVFHQGTPM